VGELRIDLNADVGEGFGTWVQGDDEALFPFLSSVNMACGFHAGDPSIMERTVSSARQHGLAIGAHPGHADLRGFGRRAIAVLPAEIEADVLYQIGALAAFARAHSTSLTHVKPHGALYHQAAHDEALARAVARGVARFDRELVFVGPCTSALLRAAAESSGLRFAGEAFADRGYAASGALLPRGSAGALVTDPESAAAQALAIVRDGRVASTEGALVELRADTLCIHGDTPGAAAIARAVRARLEAAGIEVAPLAR
jgi:5-oxoprolinase (ATP-hydrolysing) subunit A